MTSTVELTDDQRSQLKQLAEHTAGTDMGKVSSKELEDMSQKLFDNRFSLAWIRNTAPKVSRGVYNVTSLFDGMEIPAPVQNVDVKHTQPTATSSDPTYVPGPNHKRVRQIVKSGLFFPIFITGLSGCGKTLMVHEVCHELGRKLFRCNITNETDEDSLFGGLRLNDGNTIFEYGAVVEAMKCGGVLLLDEVDLGSEDMMCLQPVLEGKPVLIKRVNEVVYPAEGFTVIATANTKGKGDASGNFAFTNVLNEAFLDRFSATLYQNYPGRTQEFEILIKASDHYGSSNRDFCNKLTRWAESVRTAYTEDACDQVITTRRLVDIIKAYSIFDNKVEALKLCLERFDEDDRDALIDLYTKVDETVDLSMLRSLHDDDSTIDIKF